MSTFVSKTKQVGSPHAWTFAGLSVDDAGVCYAAERKGLRDIKAKGLLVRYPNPFAGGGEPEVLYECSDSLQHSWRSPTGEHHLLGKKHHFQLNGKFKSKEVTKRAQRLVRIHGFGDRLLVALGWPEAYLEIVKGEYVPLDVGLPELCEDLAGTGSDDIYVSSSAGIAHFDGKKWQRVKGAPEQAQLACVSRDEVFTTGIDPVKGHIFAAYRGNARTGFKGVVACEGLPNNGDFNRILHALGAVHLIQTHDEQSGLYRLDGTKVEWIMNATSFTGRAAGNDDVLWVENGIELLCFDGKKWQQVPRVWHDKTKG